MIFDWLWELKLSNIESEKLLFAEYLVKLKTVKQKSLLWHSLLIELVLYANVGIITCAHAYSPGNYV